MPKTNPILADLQSERWAMEKDRLEAFIQQLAKMPDSSASSIYQIAISPRKQNLQVVNGVANIVISGVLLKTVPDWLKLWGYNATGYDDIKQQVESAAANTSVNAIHLQISSPGGTISGLDEAAGAIYQARENKQVTATIEDLGASAAYWLASQAETIEANKTAEVGSIGVYSAYTDWTGFDEAMGIKVIVIRSGEHKGMGVDGITENQIAAVQEIIDAMADDFISAVARGRNMDKAGVGQLADGRLWIARTAQQLGLIDTITNAQSQTENDQDTESLGDTLMPDTKQTDSTAEAVDTSAITDQTLASERQRMADLKAAFPDDLAFALEQFDAGATVEQAKATYCDKLMAQQNTDTTKSAASGIEPLRDSGEGAGTDTGDFMTEARALADSKNISMTEAMGRIQASQPELYERFLNDSRSKRLTVKSGKAERVSR